MCRPGFNVTLLYARETPVVEIPIVDTLLVVTSGVADSIDNMLFKAVQYITVLYIQYAVEYSTKHTVQY